ncbi:sigma-70 family RNA polymerase sigma factor [Thalassomonas viridans]|uniref:Sigma-70 family RNA polymerase sigma factor n=1 Tax=Thalassomonas viridans TaxID=137584 RepID=A0AAE9Z8J1_9GAMM|nr:ECF-type sigma factor [Thalassomonas viridans]WDE08726.1 sigma-70 family RNA polymerase sigma factor [Thalassomonas viridans]
MTKDVTTLLTQTLHQWKYGNQAAKLDLDNLLVQELHRLAQVYMARENPSHTLQATALVNEVFLRLAHVDVDWQDKKHFIVIASKTMRRILVDHAKRKNAQKRMSLQDKMTFDENSLPHHQATEELIVLNDLLDKLTAFDERACNMLELSIFGGLTHPEVADVTGFSLSTVEREIRVAQAWLRGQP